MTVKMMKVVAAMSIAVCLGTASAQQAISVNFGQQGTSEAPQAESDTVKVQGRGVGVNKTAALKDAYRDAIERAVGLYVDAETVANNDQIVKDQVLTQSNAYITDYRELSSERINGGLMQVRILATVKKQALTTKLTGVMPAQTVRIDSSGLQNVHAQLVTKEKRAEDGAALLKNALGGLNPMKSLMVANIRPETQKIITADDVNNDRRRYRREAQLKSNQVMLRYLFEVKLDREKYFAEFVPSIKNVLDQISLSKPKEIRLTELMYHPESSFMNRADMLECFFNGNRVNEKGRRVCDDHWSDYDMIVYNPVHVYSILWKGDNLTWEQPRQSNDGLWFDFFRGRYGPKTGGSNNSWQHTRNSWQHTRVCFDYFNSHRGDERMTKILFAMINSLNGDCSNGKVTIYELEGSMFSILTEWHRKLVGKGGSSRYESGQNKTNFNILLLGKDGEEIGVYPWQIPNAVLMNVKFGEIRLWGETWAKKDECMVYATPFVGCFGESLLQWRDFILEKDQLTKVASIKIEPAD